MVLYMSSKGIFIRVDERLLEKFSRVARSMGLNRSEAIRRAMEMFIAIQEKESYTGRMRGIVKSRLSLKDLEEIYRVSK